MLVSVATTVDNSIPFINHASDTDPENEFRLRAEEFAAERNPRVILPSEKMRGQGSLT